MSENTTFNNDLGTRNIIWNLSDIYTGIDDPKLLADMAWCTDEATSVHKEYYG